MDGMWMEANLRTRIPWMRVLGPGARWAEPPKLSASSAPLQWAGSGLGRWQATDWGSGGQRQLDGARLLARAQAWSPCGEPSGPPSAPHLPACLALSFRLRRGAHAVSTPSALWAPTNDHLPAQHRRPQTLAACHTCTVVEIFCERSCLHLTCACHFACAPLATPVSPLAANTPRRHLLA